MMTPWHDTKTYIVCTTARSGSNLFCDFLKNTKSLGHPIEAFNPDIIRKSAFYKSVDEEDSISVDSYISWISKRHRTQNGIFGTKLLFEDFDMFRGFSAFSTLFRNAFVVHLRRRSKLRQAISYYFAEKTGQWVSTDIAQLDPADVPFDFDEIDRHMRRLIIQDATWSSILQGMGQRYMEVYFEDFVAAPAETISAMLMEFGSSGQDVPVFATLQEQRNPRTAEFIKSFEMELPNRLFAERASQRYKGSTFVD